MRGVLKSLPPAILIPHGAPPTRVTENGSPISNFLKNIFSLESKGLSGFAEAGLRDLRVTHLGIKGKILFSPLNT